ncbi:transcriptional repressor LexA [Caldilinea sp.]|uniref:transcriptional repressor LexA n=1 Tax=Caldilinea sp. TaxID=2293560 RepID=UPI002C1F3F86|nr:transcriptional repressor LexA [Anaerolineales bacterium]HQY90946.1 transcriptional repressor LexA [Caldilinea sp.]HRA64709.1 transcriptional repressor LexA [Caldilinea sp.]
MHFSDLSMRQQKILRFILAFTTSHHYPPTIREIGDEVGISSTSVVNYNLSKLEDFELISRDREVSRGLSLNLSRLAEIGLAFDESNGDYASAMNGLAASAGNARSTRFRVPVLGKIAAGQPIPVIPSEPYDPEGWIELTEGMLSLPTGRLFALRVQGNSMIDASVLNGDIVILQQQETANNGDMVAAWIEGDEETTLKYLKREGDMVHLMPANPNPEYQPIVRPADKVRINGKVVSVIRML